MRLTMKMLDERPSTGPRTVGLFSILVGLAFGVIVAQPGCAENSCTPSNGDNNTPGPAFECAAGEVCYLGKCIKTCSAGAELFDKCQSDDDCSGARPNCVRTFCSSCDNGQACVPNLNICQNISEVIRPDRMSRPDEPPVVDQRPLDAGFTPGGLTKPVRDGGLAEQPQDREVTRVAFIDLGRQRDVSVEAGQEIAIASVRAFDTAIGAGNGLKWRVDVNPPRVEVDFPDPTQNPGAPQNTIDEFCRIRRLDEVTGPGGSPTAAPIGDIRMGNPADFPDSITPELSAEFINGGYQVTPTPSNSFLTFSVAQPTEPHFVFVSGSALIGVIATPWPEVGDFGHHVPFELVPTDPTLASMRGGLRVTQPASQDLTFRYNRIEIDNDPSEEVIVRITGRQTELFCPQTEGEGEGGEIQVRAGILDAFRLAEGITAPTTYDLYFERASRELVPPRPVADELVLVTVRIRHSLRTPIVFE